MSKSLSDLTLRGAMDTCGNQPNHSVSHDIFDKDQNNDNFKNMSTFQHETSLPESKHTITSTNKSLDGEEPLIKDVTDVKIVTLDKFEVCQNRNNAIEETTAYLRKNDTKSIRNVSHTYGTKECKIQNDIHQKDIPMILADSHKVILITALYQIMVFSSLKITTNYQLNISISYF